MAEVKVLCHSSIRIEGERTVYFDPFKVDAAYADADAVFVTHDHFDHYSEEDINKVMKEGTVLVVPRSLEKKAKKLAGNDNVIAVKPGDTFEVCGLKAEAVAAYNVGKMFHPKLNGWVGYVVTMDGKRYYVAGDTDKNKDNENVKCDVALVPAGGKFTMNAEEAAEFVNILKPEKAIPTHYGEVAGSPEDGEIFASKVDKGIEVEIQLRF